MLSASKQLTKEEDSVSIKHWIFLKNSDEI